MIRIWKSLLVASLFVVFSTSLFVAPESHAALACADLVEKAKRRTGDVSAPMPHMGTAARHVAAAEEALRSGDENKCLEEVQKTEKWLRMNRERRGDR